MSSGKQQHRGAHPEDQRLFAPERVATLRIATAELSWLLSRGYTTTAAVKLVGDRHQLNERQRLAISRAACPDTSRARRLATRVEHRQIAGEALIVDGFNLLITVEAALSGGLIMLCRDTCIRDLASVHGSYRSVQETDRAIDLIGEGLARLAPREVCWLLDKPISNSGRLAERLREHAARSQWPWHVDVVFNPDSTITASERIAVSSDAIVLNGVARWVDLNGYLIGRYLPDAWLLDLRDEP
ncbi:MAG TPA: DUF434 domain-containing protein [Herpetosiphonaceae bacterium]